jgi:hypothetical protein
MPSQSPGFTPDFVAYMIELEKRVAAAGSTGTSVDTSNFATKADLTPLAKKTDIPDMSGVAKKTDLPDVTKLATKNDVPVLSDSKPAPEAMAGKAGTASQVSRDDHTHERLTETFKGTLDSAGKATITFAKTYAVQPVAIPQGIKAGSPISWDKEYVGSDGAWTGVKITGYKSSQMPTTPILSLTTLLGGVIVGINTIIGIVSGYNPVQPAVNAMYDGYVLKSSQAG